MNMILNTNEDGKVTMIRTKENQPPISILKNRICPRNPAYPNKCMVGYENLKQNCIENSRGLATVMNYTWNSVLKSNSYLRRSTEPLDWNKSIEGTNFYQRTDRWMYEKERKIENLRDMLIDQETRDCTFHPETSSSPQRRSKLW